jgi:hypothetical protein
MLAVNETTQIRKRQLASVLKLIDRLLAFKDSWHGIDVAEGRLLSELCALTGQRLPKDATSSASVMLGFLVLLRFLLERNSRLSLQQADVH